MIEFALRRLKFYFVLGQSNKTIAEQMGIHPCSPCSANGILPLVRIRLSLV